MSIDITEAQTTSYTTENYQQRAANIYKLYLTQYKTRFKWIRSDLSLPFLKDQLTTDANALIQIGQTSETILCYSFLPTEGVERIIDLRGRVRARLQQNAEVILSLPFAADSNRYSQPSTP